MGQWEGHCPRRAHTHAHIPHTHIETHTHTYVQKSQFEGVDPIKEPVGDAVAWRWDRCREWLEALVSISRIFPGWGDISFAFWEALPGVEPRKLGRYPGSWGRETIGLVTMFQMTSDTALNWDVGSHEGPGRSLKVRGS